MKNFKLAFAAIVFSAFAANAQTQDKPKLTDAQKQEMKAQFKESKERLALTPDQEKSFIAINKKYAPEMKAVKQSETDRKEKHQKMKDLRDRKNDEIKAMLSEKQYQTYLEIQRKQHRKDRRKEDTQPKE